MTGLSDKELREMAVLLQERTDWLVLAHEKPDGDTLGCAAAVAALGRRLGKNIFLGGPDSFPDHYAFLLGGLDYQVLDALPTTFSVGRGVVICLDTSNQARSVAWLADISGRCPIVNIDHHADNERYGDVNWVDATASATGEMITAFFLSQPWGLLPEEANALYVAIVTDNGDFSYPSTTLRSHECAIQLMRHGASPSTVSACLNSSLSAGTLRLWAMAMSRVETFAQGEGALFWLAESDFSQTGTTRQDTENLVNFLLRIHGVRIAALCCENPEGIRVSIRSRVPLSARKIAAVFGGGGHELAAGCMIAAPLCDAVSAVRAEMEQYARTRPAVT